MDYTHGIAYTPSNVKSSTTAPLTLQDLEELGISYVHVYWVDLANTRRSRILPVEYFTTLMRHSNRPGVNIARVGLGMVYLMVAEGFSGIGEYLYVPDLSTLRLLSGVGQGKVAGVLGRFEEKDTSRGNGVEVGLCPRTVLAKVVEDAKRSCSAEFLVGFETEFILLKHTKPVTPSDIHQWSASSALLAGSREAIVLHEICNALRASGIALQMCHAEAAPGQYEVVTGPLDPLDAADALIYTREIITHVAATYGLHATFAPRPFMNSTGSSTHAHISVHSPEGKAPSQLSKYEEGFLAGLLEHLPAIAAFSLPTSASYKRVVEGVWSGGTYVSYGTENREVPIRLTNAASPSSRNFELRFIDGTANPYLALAAILAGGVTGIKTKQVLRTKDCQSKSAGEMSEEERREMGITKRMSLSIDEARRNLREDVVLGEAVGKELVETFLAVNKTLEEALTQDADEAKELTRLVEYY